MTGNIILSFFDRELSFIIWQSAIFFDDEEVCEAKR